MRRAAAFLVTMGLTALVVPATAPPASATTYRGPYSAQVCKQTRIKVEALSGKNTTGDCFYTSKLGKPGYYFPVY